MFVMKKRFERMMRRVAELESKYYDLKSGQEFSYLDMAYRSPALGSRYPTIALRRVVRLITQHLGLEVVKDHGKSATYNLEAFEVFDAEGGE